MTRKSQSKHSPCVHPRLRVVVGDEIALGPGKVELLALVKETGSIGKAAKRMGMSYMRAWSLIQTMNRCFREPLVTAVHGGKGGGGADLTEAGRRALDLYRRMERASLQALAPSWKQMRRLLSV